MASAIAMLLLVEELERIENVPRRIFRDRSDPFGLPDSDFMTLFRLDKDLVLYVTEKITPVLPANGLPPQLRVLVALRFFATGCSQNSVANDTQLAVSQGTVSRSIASVSKAIANILMPEEIQFPRLAEQAAIKQRFLAASGLPGVIGAIDCIHVAIIKPSENSERVRPLSYLNRKNFFSINVQLVVDDDLTIRAINARYPGSVHDSFIWRYSAMKQFIVAQYENGVTDSWLIGDSGYPLQPWLLKPFKNPALHSSEELFNERLSSARSTVERCTCVLKSRFRCLLKHRVLHYSPTQSSFIINACAVLHNLCNKKKLPLEEFNSDHDDEDKEATNVSASKKWLAIAKNVQQRVVENLK